MKMREGRCGPRRYPCAILVGLRALSSVCMIAAFAGCGGQVVVSDDGLAEGDAVQDGGAGSAGGAPSLGAGQCVTCKGQPECAFCRVHGLSTTYLCPPSKPAPKAGCMNLGEAYTSSEGDAFTCYYCS